MAQSITLVIYPVTDLAQGRTLFSKFLGTQPDADRPYYVGFKIGDQEVGLDPNGYKQGMTGPVGYAQVDDIRKSLQVLLDAGAKPLQEVKDLGGGKLIASVKDSAGNTLAFMQMP